MISARLLGSESNEQCPYKRQKRKTQTHRGKDHVKTEAEIGMMQPSVKERQGSPATTKG